MENKKSFKCGVVSIVGRPNTGKSTLLNKIVDEKIAIVSKIPQTTRNQIRGIYNDERGQIIFIDTPGFHYARDNFDKLMNQSSSVAMQDMDCIIYLVDANKRIGEEEEIVASKLKGVKCPLVLGLNKVDLKGGKIPEYIAFWERIKGKPINEIDDFTLLPIAGERGTNIEKLIDILFSYLPEGPALYPTDIISDVPKKMVISDIIREKFLRILRQEIPHSLGVFIEHMQPRRGKVLHIKVVVFIEKMSQKEIVIGRNGKVLKQVGTQARAELEELLESKVFLDLHVKVQKNWRDKLSFLQEVGYETR
ncbi:MAG: GTPase Era [Candidatus Zapsychrus exili]|nr:GTPase Era [Candidatus Zapsychrus exili]